VFLIVVTKTTDSKLATFSWTTMAANRESNYVPLLCSNTEPVPDDDDNDDMLI